jgi:hypothetical protein
VDEAEGQGGGWIVHQLDPVDQGQAGAVGQLRQDLAKRTVCRAASWLSRSERGVCSIS